MTENDHFSWTDFAVLRLSALPASRAADTHVDLDPRDRARSEDYLRSVTSDPFVREAIAVSSPSLAHTLAAVDAGGPVEARRLRRAVLATTRYLLRTATRPTPFGLMAGVTTAHFGGPATAALGARRRKAVRPDAGWLADLVRRHERDPEVLRALRVVVNDLCFERGGRVVLPFVVGSATEGDRPYREISVRATPVVRAVLERARTPIGFTDLAAHLVARFPEDDPARIESVLTHLVGQAILLTELAPPPSAADPLAHVADRVPGDPVLTATTAGARAYAAAPVGAGLAAWHELIRATGSDGGGRRAPHVDLAYDADVRLPAAVATEIAAAAGVLTRVTPPSLGPTPLAPYLAEFHERYGPGRLVPLRELLDPVTGLGPPAGYRMPPGPRRSTPRSGSGGVGDRERTLALLAQQAIAEHAVEVELDDATLARLSAEDDGAVPSTLEVGVNIVAASTAALDRGDFVLALSLMPLSGQAGALAGRFTRLLGLPRARSPEFNGAIEAQIEFAPSLPRLGNVVRVPKLTEYSLPVGVFADRDDPSVIGIDDLFIGSDDTRLFAWSGRLGAEIVPTTLHMLDLSVLAPNTVRFLRELTFVRNRACARWTWGTAEGLFARLPRVRRGRTILSSATWRLDPLLSDAGLTTAEWERRLNAWRRRWEVPSQVYATSSDNRVGLDLDSGLHRAVLRDEPAAGRRPVIVEPPAGGGFGSGWLDGRAAELVVSLHARSAGPAARPRATVVVAHPRHLPGGEWIYARLQVPADRHSELIRDRLPELRSAVAPAVDRWFFLRYRDPDPHLRLRFHGEPARLNREVLPALHDWAARLADTGVLRGLVLDTYEPEVSRYGGPDALRAAERAFAADSEAVAEQLALAPDLPPELLAAANHLDLARAFDPEGWRDWFLASYPKGGFHHAFQAVRRQALAVTGPDGADPRLAAIWARRAAAVRAYGAVVRELGAPSTLGSLLHMHHNRLIGIDPASEGASYAIARGVVQARLDRERHGHR